MSDGGCAVCAAGRQPGPIMEAPDGPRAGKETRGRLAVPLSPREREVAVLLAQGLTNRQIAERLIITPGTASVHVEHILNKLAMRSRAQVAAWAVARGLATG